MSQKKTPIFSLDFVDRVFVLFLSSAAGNAVNTSISAVTIAENAVNSSIFVLDEEDRRTMQSKFTARRILLFCGVAVGWGGGE